MPATDPGEIAQVSLDAGEYLLIEEETSLTGAVIESDKPVGVFVGHQCMYWPPSVPACDHAEQMLPPVQSLGSQYAAVPVSRVGEPGVWRLLGAVDGTELTYSHDVLGPESLDEGEERLIVTDQPFEIRSQDPDHPFWLFNLMPGQHWLFETTDLGELDVAWGQLGDPDFVMSTPLPHYGKEYMFFVDPSYEVLQLVVVRQRNDGSGDSQAAGFAEVQLDCAELDDWKPLTEDLEWTRHRSDIGDIADPFVGTGCAAGPHHISSSAPFGLWVWVYSAYSSLGYTAAPSARPLNDAIVPVG